jgi:hypothetical protein
MDFFLLICESAPARIKEIVNLAYIDNGSESINDIFVVAIAVPAHFARDIVDELSEKRHLKQLIGSNELECLDTVWLQATRKGSIGWGPTGKLVNLFHLGGIEIWKSICQWVREGCCGG